MVLLTAAVEAFPAAPAAGLGGAIDGSLGILGGGASCTSLGTFEDVGVGGTGGGWEPLGLGSVSLCKPAQGFLPVPRGREGGCERTRGPETLTPAIRSAFLWRDMSEDGQASARTRAREIGDGSVNLRVLGISLHPSIAAG